MEEVKETREFPKEIKNLINDLRQKLMKYNYAFGAVFIAHIKDDSNEVNHLLVMADGTPEHLRMEMLISMQETVANAIVYYSKGDKPIVH